MYISILLHQIDTNIGEGCILVYCCIRLIVIICHSLRLILLLDTRRYVIQSPVHLNLSWIIASEIWGVCCKSQSSLFQHPSTNTFPKATSSVAYIYKTAVPLVILVIVGFVMQYLVIDIMMVLTGNGIDIHLDITWS